MKQRTSKPNRKTAAGVWMLVLTVVYLLATSAGAQVSPKSSANTEISYTADRLSWGDVYAFSGGEFQASNYALQNVAQTATLYDSHEADKKTQNYKPTYYKYYGKVTLNDLAAPTDAAYMATHNAAEFVTSNLTETAVEAPVGNGETIPVVTTSGTGRYSVVPNAVGTYRIYIHASSKPSGVKYALLDSYTAANTYEGNPSGELDLHQVDGTAEWWYADVTVEHLGWTAYEVSVAGCSSAVNESKKDQVVVDGGTSKATPQTLEGAPLSNTTLSDSYYYNIWTAKTLKYDTVLVLQFPSTAKLGPITKTGDTFTYAQTAGGTVSVETIFGEPVTSGDAVPHMPLYITATPDQGNTFAGLTGAAGQTRSVADDVFRYDYEQTESVTATWKVRRELPAVTVNGSGVDFYLNPTTETNFEAGSLHDYTFAFDFSGAESGSAIDYSVVYTGGGTNASGTLSADGSFGVSLAWGRATVTLTAKIDGTAIETMTYAIVADESGFPYVCKIGSTQYRFLEDALAASAANNTIIMTANYEMRSSGKPAWGAIGTGAGYVVKSGVTVLLPYASGQTTIRTRTDSSGFEESNCTLNTANTNAFLPNNALYLQLTVPEEVTVVNNGRIVVGGTLASATGAGGIACATSGSHSNLVVDGTIVMNSGSRLSTAGYVLGSGTVSATASGAKIYQPFSVLDFNGGGYTVSAAGKGVSSNYGGTYPSGENGIIPFIRYATQNIQCDLVMKQGNYMYGYCDLYAGGGHNTTCACLVGDSATEGLVILSSGATLTGAYDADVVSSSTSNANARVGKMTLTVNGGGNLGALIMDVGVDVDMSRYAFPIPYNYDIAMENGDYTFIHDMQILPGATFILEDDANLTISKNARLSVHDGMHEFRDGGNSKNSYSVAWSTSYGRYPAASTLGTVSHGTYTGNMIINGTLTIASGSTLAGVVQTNGTGTVVMNGSTAGISNQIGMVGSASTNNGTYIWAGATVYTHRPEIFDTLTGQRIPMQQGLTYHGAAGASILEDFTYELYTTSANTGIHETHTEVINANTEGSWWNYTGTVKVVKTDGTEISSTPAHVAAGADLSAYYANSSCTTPATTVSANGFVLYVPSGSTVARVEWAAGGNPSYYMSLKDAVAAATHAGDRVVLMRDVTQTETIGIGSTQDLTICLADGGESYTITARSEFLKNSGTVTLDVGGSTVATDASSTLASGQTAFISNAGTMTIDLNGGLLDFATGLTAASATYRGKAAVVNDGDLTITDTAGGGRLTTDLLQDNSTVANYTAAVWNHAAATLAITGGTIETTQAVNNYSAAVVNLTATVAEITNATLTVNRGYGIFSYNGATIGTIDNATITVNHASGAYGIYNHTNSTINAIKDSTIQTVNTVALHNYNNSTITTLKGTALAIAAPTTKNAYALWNYGADIETIDGCTITGNSGINNRNLRANANTNQATGATIKYYGHIGTIKDTEITVGQYAIYNGAAIDEISGHSVLTAAPASAQVNQATGTAALNGNVQCYTVVNSNLWWYDTAVWKRTDTNVTNGDTTMLQRRVDQYKTDDAYMPTIGTIKDTVEIIANNTSTSVGYGYALQNYGIIDEIIGSVQIKSQVAAGNTKITTSQYALQNINGGRINTIGSGVTISANNYAIDNRGARYEKTDVTYSTTYLESNKLKSGGLATDYDYTFADPSYIGTIAGTVSAVSTYAIQNYSTINSITGDISANYNVIVNQAATTTTTGIEVVTANERAIEHRYFTDNDSSATANEYSRCFEYTRNTTDGCYIGSITGTVTATGEGYQAIYNQGFIGTLGGTVTTPAGKATSGSTYYPLIYNGDQRQATLKQTETYYTETNGAGATKYLKEYTYDVPTIDTLSCTATNPRDYTLRNLGTINTLSGTLSGNTITVANETGTYRTRKTIMFYSSASRLAASKASSEVNYEYTKQQARINAIDGATITTTKTTNALRNYGYVGTITGSTIKSKTTGTITNASMTITNYTSNRLDVLTGCVPNGTSSCALAYDQTRTITEHEDRALAVIDCIGAGNYINGTGTAIANTARINIIDSGSGTKTIIYTSDNAAGVYNYQGQYTTRNNTNAELTNTTGTLTNHYTYTYVPASIGTIKNVYILAKCNAIYNGSNNATYDPVTIGEIGEGAEVCNTAADYDVVYNYATNARIETISGGVFTAVSGSNFAVNNAGTAYPIAITGGDFRGGDGTRAKAISDADNTAKYTYPADKVLSSITETAAYHTLSGTNLTAKTNTYYFLNDFVTVTFSPNGGTGESRTQKVEKGAKAKLDAEAGMGFGSQPGKSFDHWNTAADGTGDSYEDQAEVTFGANTTLYAVWSSASTYTVTLTWPEALRFTYTPRVTTTYTWNGEDKLYQKDTATTMEGGSWSEAQTITVDNASTAGAVDARFAFAPAAGLSWTPTLHFGGSADDLVAGPYSAASIAASGGTATVYARPIAPPPENSSGDLGAIGTITVTITAS